MWTFLPCFACSGLHFWQISNGSLLRNWLPPRRSPRSEPTFPTPLPPLAGRPAHSAPRTDSGGRWPQRVALPGHGRGAAGRHCLPLPLLRMGRPCAAAVRWPPCCAQRRRALPPCAPGPVPQSVPLPPCATRAQPVRPSLPLGLPPPPAAARRTAAAARCRLWRVVWIVWRQPFFLHERRFPSSGTGSWTAARLARVEGREAAGRRCGAGRREGRAARVRAAGSGRQGRRAGTLTDPSRGIWR